MILPRGEPVEADNVLVTVGRAAYLVGYGLEELTLRMDGPLIQIDDRCRISLRGVYAIGDVTVGPMLALGATAQAGSWPMLLPDIRMFGADSASEVAAVGLLSGEAEARGITVVSEFPSKTSGCALTLDDTDGFVRVVPRSSDHVVLGIQATAAGVSELLAGLHAGDRSGAQAGEHCCSNPSS